MSDTVNKIILGFLFFLLTILMNTMFRQAPLKHYSPSTTTVTIEKTVKKVETHSNFSNNQKAAFFFAFPLGGMIWITIYSMYRNRKKLKEITGIVREPKVVF